MKRKTKDFKSACKVKGMDATKLPDVSKLPEEYGKFLTDIYKMAVITDAINKENNDWEPDYSDMSQRKYRPWFRFGSGGWAFDGYALWNADSLVGSRLVCGNLEDAKYAGKIFVKEGFTI